MAGINQFLQHNTIVYSIMGIVALAGNILYKDLLLVGFPLRTGAIFFRENMNIYLHFMSFLHTNKTQVVEIPPRVRLGLAYPTK